MHVILYEDSRVADLYPITISRPACAIHTGSLNLFELMARFGDSVEILVRPHLRRVIKKRHPSAWFFEGQNRRGGVLAVNARTVPCASLIGRLDELVKKQPKTALLTESGDLAAVWLGEIPELERADLTTEHFAELLDKLAPFEAFRPGGVELMNNACDPIRNHLKYFNENIQYRLETGDYREIADGVFIPRDDTLAPVLGEYLVTRTKNGPILIESGANLGPFCFIEGPVYIGRRCKVIEHAAIKDRVAIHDVTKIGGEVEGSTIEPYSNKQHHGFLGHSYLGSWVNLGAGTCNSDLKNSYNEVWLDTPKGKVRSDMQFLGCVIGDYAKTAINTSIFTGKTIGACSLNYGFVTTAVPSFVNYARTFGQVTEVSLKMMIMTQANMFARRGVEQTQADIELLRSMFELTRCERQLANEPLSL